MLMLKLEQNKDRSLTFVSAHGLCLPQFFVQTPLGHSGNLGCFSALQGLQIAAEPFSEIRAEPEMSGECFSVCLWGKPLAWALWPEMCASRSEAPSLSGYCI